MNKRIENINLMECFLDKCNELLKYKYLSNMQEVMLEYMIYQLSLYYSSKQWIKDYDDYESGLIPKNIKCGVLSQDAVYNLLDEYKNYKLNK